MATNNLNFNAGVTNKQAFINQATAMGQVAGRAGSQAYQKSFDLGRISGDFSKFRDSVDSATARVLAFTATTSLLYGTAAAFKRLTTDAIKVESVMTRIKSITNSTNDTIKTFQKEIFNLANQTSTSFEEAASAAEEFSRQGYNLNQTLDATKAALAIAKLSGKSAQSTIEGLTATMTTFGDKAGTFTDVAGKLLALDTKFATSAAGIINGLTRMAGVAEQAGLSFDEAASALAALKQETGRSEAVLGNSIKSIFTSIQSDKVIKELRSVGVEVESSGGEFRNLVDVVRDLSKAYDGLNDAQKAALRQNVAGKYQANAFEGLLSAFKQGGTFDKALQVSGDSKGQLDKRLDAIFGTSEAGLQRLSNRITEFGAQVGTKLGLPIANGFAKGLQSALDTASGLFSENGKGIGDALVSGIVNVIKGPGLLLLGSALASLFKRFAGDAIQAVGSLISINSKKEQGLAIDSEALRIYNALSAAEQARISNLSTIEQRQTAILAVMRQQLTAKEAGAATVVGPVGFSAANLSALQRNRLYGQIGRTTKSRASGDLPEQMAILRESADIRSGVGGARPTAQPKVVSVNLGSGQERVVVNTDERVVPNFAGSGQHAIINREMMGYARGRIPNYASGEPVYVFHAYKDLGKDKYGPYQGKGFKGSGYIPVTYDNIEAISRKNKALGIRPRIIDPTGSLSYVGQDGLTKEILSGFRVTLAKSVGLNKYQETIAGNLGGGATLASNIPGFSGYRSPKAIKQILDYGNRRYGEGNFFIKGAIGAGGDSVFSPYSFQNKFKGGKAVGERKYIPKRFGPNSTNGELLIQKAISGGKELRVTGTIVGNSASIANVNNRSVKSFFGSDKVPFLTRRIAELQVDKAVKNFGSTYNQSTFGADVLSTQNKGLSKVLQYVGLRTGLNIGKQSGGVIEMNFSQYGGNVQEGASGTFLQPKSVIGASRAIEKASRKQSNIFVSRGKSILSQSGESQQRNFKQFYKDLLGYKKYDEYGYLQTVKKLGKLGFGVTAGRGFAKRFIPYQSLAGGYVPLPRNQRFNARKKAANPLPIPTPQGPQLSFTPDPLSVRAQNIGNTIVSNSGSYKGLSGADKRLFERNKFAFSEEVRQARGEYLQRRQQRASGALGAGFIASIGGGALASRFTGPNGEETNASQKISGISNSIGTGLSIAGLSGGNPIGVAVGVAVAALGSLNAVLSKGPDEMNKYKAKLEDLGKKYEKQSAAIDGYIQNFDALNEAIANGSKEAAIAATSALKTTLKDADPELRQRLTKATTKDEIVQIGEEIKASTLRKAAASQASIEVENLLKNNKQFNGNAYLEPSDSKKLVESLTDAVDLSKIPDAIKKQILEPTGLKPNLTGFSDQLDSESRKIREGFREGSVQTLSEGLQKSLEDRIRIEDEANKKIKRVLENRSLQANYQYLTRKSFNDQQLSNFRGSLNRREGFAIAGTKLESIQDTLSPQELLKRKADNDILKSSADFLDQRNDAFKNIVEQAQGYLSKVNLDRTSAGVVSSAFTKFGENGNVNDLTRSLQNYLSPDQITELQETSADQLLVLQKSYEELQSNNRITQATYQANLEQIRLQQKASLFGAANPTASIKGNIDTYKKGITAGNKEREYSRYEPGLDERNRLPKYYEDPFTGKLTHAPSDKQLNNERYRALSVNAERGRDILAGQDAGIDAGFYGFHFKPGSPAFVMQEKLKSKERDKTKRAYEDILEKNRIDSAFADYDATSKQIIDEETKNIGYSPFKEVDKKIRSQFGGGDTSAFSAMVRDYVDNNEDFNKYTHGSVKYDEQGVPRRTGANFNLFPTEEKLHSLSYRLKFNADNKDAIPDVAQQYADKKFAASPDEQLLDESKKSNEFLQAIQKSSDDLVKQIQVIGLSREQSILEAEKSKLNNRLGVVNDYGVPMEERTNARNQVNQSLQDVVSGLAKVAAQLESTKGDNKILAEITNDLKISMNGVAVSQAVVDAITPIVTDAVYENLINQGFDIKRIPRK